MSTRFPDSLTPLWLFTFQKKMKEFLVRIIYAEMLGHDASFGYIQAVQMTASTNLIQKRTGYLCAGLCLHPDHELRFMLVNQLQRVRAERERERGGFYGGVCWNEGERAA